MATMTKAQLLAENAALRSELDSLRMITKSTQAPSRLVWGSKAWKVARDKAIAAAKKLGKPVSLNNV